MGDLRLEDEYRIARDAMGLSGDQLDQVQRNGVQAAFLPEEEKVRLFGS
jgi:adenosine deaminase